MKTLNITLPFIAAIENDMRVVMPYYGIPTAQTDEEVAMAYNRYILTDLLRDELGFEGGLYRLGRCHWPHLGC